jgi:hypothetical protein
VLWQRSELHTLKVQVLSAAATPICLVGTQDASKLTTGNHNLHRTSNNSGLTVQCHIKKPNSTEHQVPKSQYSWTFLDRMTHRQTDHVLIDDGIQAYLMSDHSEELTTSKQAM